MSFSLIFAPPLLAMFQRPWECCHTIEYSRPRRVTHIEYSSQTFATRFSPTYHLNNFNPHLLWQYRIALLYCLVQDQGDRLGRVRHFESCGQALQSVGLKFAVVTLKDGDKPFTEEISQLGGRDSLNDNRQVVQSQLSCLVLKTQSRKLVHIHR